MFKALKKLVHRLWYPTPAITPAEQGEFDSSRLQKEIATLQAAIDHLKSTHEFSDLMSQATAFGLPSPTLEDKKAFVLSNDGQTIEESNNTLVKKMVDVRKNGDEISRFLDITSTISSLNLEAKARAAKGAIVKWSPDSIMNKMSFDTNGRAEQKVYLEVGDTGGSTNVYDYLPGFNKVASTEVSGINVADIDNPVASDPVRETEEDKSIDIIEVRDPTEILEKAHKAREAYYATIKQNTVSEGSTYATHLSKALRDGSLSGRGAVFDGTDLTYWTPANEAEANLRKKLSDRMAQDDKRIREEMELENAKWNWVEFGTYSCLDPNPPGLDQYVRTHPSKARNLENVSSETGLYVPFEARQNKAEDVPPNDQSPHPASQVWREKTAGEVAFEEGRTSMRNINDKITDAEYKAAAMLDKVKNNAPLTQEEQKLFDDLQETKNKLALEAQERKVKEDRMLQAIMAEAEKTD